MILYLGDLKDSIKRLLPDKFRNVVGYIIDIKKPIALLYPKWTSRERNKKNNTHTIASNKITKDLPNQGSKGPLQ